MLNGAQEIEPYRPDTGGATRYPAGVLVVTEVSAVPRILEAANAHRVSARRVFPTTYFAPKHGVSDI